MPLGFPPKVVPLEAVFIVILWKCSKNLRNQVAVVVGLWIAWASRSLRRVVHVLLEKANEKYLYWDEFKYLDFPAKVSKEKAWLYLSCLSSYFEFFS